MTFEDACAIVAPLNAVAAIAPREPTIAERLAAYGITSEAGAGHSQRRYLRHAEQPLGMANAFEAAALLGILDAHSKALREAESAKLASDLRASLLLTALQDLDACLDSYFRGGIDTGLSAAQDRAKAAIQMAIAPTAAVTFDPERPF